MKKKSDKEITIKCCYKNDGKDIVQILTSSILLYIESEVHKLCAQRS